MKPTQALFTAILYAYASLPLTASLSDTSSPPPCPTPPSEFSSYKASQPAPPQKVTLQDLAPNLVVFDSSKSQMIVEGYTREHIESELPKSVVSMIVDHLTEESVDKFFDFYLQLYGAARFVHHPSHIKPSIIHPLACGICQKDLLLSPQALRRRVSVVRPEPCIFCTRFSKDNKNTVLRQGLGDLLIRIKNLPYKVKENRDNVKENCACFSYTKILLAPFSALVQHVLDPKDACLFRRPSSRYAPYIALSEEARKELSPLFSSIVEREKEIRKTEEAANRKAKRSDIAHQ